MNDMSLENGKQRGLKLPPGVELNRGNEREAREKFPGEKLSF